MTSPFPPNVGSSPFPFPGISFSPFPNPPTNPAQGGPSPLPFSIPSNPFNAPSPFTFNPTSLTPNFSFPLTGLTPTANTNANVNNLSGPTSGQVGQSTIPEEGSDEWKRLLRGLDGCGDIIDRCLVVLGEIKRLQDGLFESGAERSEGMQIGMGGLSRLELLHFEYGQLLSNLTALATSSRVGSLPVSYTVPITSDKPKAKDSTNEDSTTTTAETATSETTEKEGETMDQDIPNEPKPEETRPMTMDDLVEWAEKRAELDFNRKEAVRTSAKTVLDVLMRR